MRGFIAALVIGVACGCAYAETKTGESQRSLNQIMRDEPRLLSKSPPAHSRPIQPRSVVPDEGVLVKRGFVTGNDYRQKDESFRGVYLMGVIDGFMFSPVFGAKQNGPLRRIKACVTDMQNTQIMAIVDKFLLDRPVQWHEDMHGLVFQALRETCPP